VRAEVVTERAPISIGEEALRAAITVVQNEVVNLSA
jgi:hypothetical protein